MSSKAEHHQWRVLAAALILVTVTLIPTSAAWEPAQEKDVNENLIRGIASLGVAGLGERAKGPAWVEVKVAGAAYAVFVKDMAVQSVKQGSAPEEPAARVSLGSKAVAVTLWNAYDKKNTANLLIDDNLVRVSFKEPSTGIWADIKNVPQRGKGVPLQIGQEVNFLGHTGTLQADEGGEFILQLGEDRYRVDKWGGIRARLMSEQVERGAEESANSLDALGEDEPADNGEAQLGEGDGEGSEHADGDTGDGTGAEGDATPKPAPVDDEQVKERARKLGMELDLTEHWSGEKVVELAKKGTFKLSDKRNQEQATSAKAVIANFAKATGLAGKDDADDKAAERVQEILGGNNLASKQGKEQRQKVAGFVKEVLKVEVTEDVKKLPPFEEKDEVLATGLALAVTILEKNQGSEEDGDDDPADPVMQERIRFMSALLHRLGTGSAEGTSGGEVA